MANSVTILRIAFSLVLLLLPAKSLPFLVLYIFAGVTDMVDGRIARYLGSESPLGAKLDTIADFVLIMVCIIKFLPLLAVPEWILLWISIIALIKISNLFTGFIRTKQLVSVPILLSKLLGFVLFLFPLTLSFVPVTFSAPLICMLATVAAVQEGYLIRTKW